MMGTPRAQAGDKALEMLLPGKAIRELCLQPFRSQRCFPASFADFGSSYWQEW